MTIRRTLLLAFLAVGLLPALALTLLAFTRTQAAMRAEIAQTLATQARVTADDVDKLMFERLQNAVTWTHLEVLQDLAVGDVDKRLSSFLAEMKLRYGAVYLDLHSTDRQGRIVASSDPAAIGRALPPVQPWLRATLSGDQVVLQAPRRNAAGQLELQLRITVRSQFEEGPIGELVLLVDWRSALGLLNASARNSRLVAVVDREGQLVAASSGGQPRLPDAAPLQVEARWLRPGADFQDRDGAPLLEGQVIAGRAASRGVGPFQGFGWTTLVLQPKATALAPVRQMAWSFATILLLTVAVTAILATAIAARIARPIMALTRYVRGFQHQQQSVPAPSADAEVGELTRAFVQLVVDLEDSRQTLVRAAQLAAIGEFAAVMAHEIRTPLGILRSSAQMLASEPNVSSEGRELLGFVVSETERMNALVAAMLDRARARPPRRAPEDIDALAARCIAMLGAQARRLGVRLEQQREGNDLVADVDAEQLMQVLFNLLQNALHVLEGGGVIRVTTRGEPQWLSIEVADSGPGIAAADRDRMFEPFVYRREGGLGLGLAVVRQIVSTHGGEIAIEQSPLGGALFRIRLPRRQQEMT